MFHRDWSPLRGIALTALAAVVASGCMIDEGEEWDTGEAVAEVTAGNLGGANLGGANLGGANLGGANLGGANLGGINLGGANLAATNLGGANLGGNNLGGANLGGANLGGANLGGANLGGANLSGTTLGVSNLSGSTATGAYPGLGCPKAGTVRLGTDLLATTSAKDIHNLGTAATKMLRSGEDVFTRTQSCVVLGIGSVALPKLISQNASDTTMYAAVAKTTWGIASTAGGPVTLSAWEVVMWGSTRYTVFIVLAPPTADYAGVTGFVKAVWRWAAPLSKTLKIGQIAGGQAVQSYTGMMDAGTHVLAGTISHRNYVAGELSFVTATTNNVSVQVDFSAAVQKTNGQTLILGNVEGAPLYFEGGYAAIQKTDGSVKIVIDSRAQHATRSNNTMVVDSLSDLNYAYSAFPTTPPVPRRCAGWKSLAWLGVSAPVGKCDDGVILDSTFALTLDTSSWVPILQAASKPVVLPYNLHMVPPSELENGVAITYILLNEPGYDIPGRTNWVFDFGWQTGQRTGTGCSAMNGWLQVTSHVATPAGGDWVGLFKTTAADTAPTVKYFTSSCSATAGTTATQRRGCRMNFTPSQIDATASYELRLFSGSTRVAKSPMTYMAADLISPCGIW